MGCVLRDWMQQPALIGIDCRALQMDTILSIEGVIAALAALGGDHNIGQLELTHFHDRGPHRHREGRAPASPNATPEPSVRHEMATTQGTPISVVMSHTTSGAAPMRTRNCRSKSSATTMASCCGGIDGQCPPRHHRLAASRSINSRRPCSAAASRDGPAADPMLSGYGGAKARCAGGRRRQMSAGSHSLPPIQLLGCTAPGERSLRL